MPVEPDEDDDDDDDGPEDAPARPGLLLPVISPDDPPETRYRRVLEALPTKDIAWVHLLSHSVLGGFHEGVLTVAFSSPFHLDQGRTRLMSAEFRALLARAFPDLAKVEGVLREARLAHLKTRAERLEEARIRYVEDLKVRVRAHPVTRTLLERTGAEIDEITPSPNVEIIP